MRSVSADTCEHVKIRWREAQNRMLGAQPDMPGRADAKPTVHPPIQRRFFAFDASANTASDTSVIHCCRGLRTIQHMLSHQRQSASARSLASPFPIRAPWPAKLLSLGTAFLSLSADHMQEPRHAPALYLILGSLCPRASTRIATAFLLVGPRPR